MRSKFPSRRSDQRGYILLTLLLFVAILAITAAVIVPEISFQVKRDREEEMIHRGVQYSRAIRHYVKKFGRYPTRLEDLDNTNNIRFLRKRYKDPITGKDFKLLHVGEVQLMPGGAPLAGATPAANLSAANSGQLPATPNSPVQGTSSNSSSNSDQNSQSSSSGNLTNQVFGGGPIVGVVSTSKDETIRVFNNKNHYNEWQFIYDPSTDRGGLLNTPAQPALQGSVPIGGAQPAGTQLQQPGTPQQNPAQPPPMPPSDPRMDN